MMAYQGGPASIPDCVFPAIWRPSVIQGLNSQSRGVFWSLCSGPLLPGELGVVVCASEVFTYSQWVMTKGLTDLLGPCGRASCCVLDLFPYKLPQCTYSSGVETVTLCVAPAPMFLLCLCLCPSECWFCPTWLVTCSVCLSMTSGSSKWDFLLGSTLFFAK